MVKRWGPAEGSGHGSRKRRITAMRRPERRRRSPMVPGGRMLVDGDVARAGVHLKDHAAAPHFALDVVLCNRTLDGHRTVDLDRSRTSPALQIDSTLPLNP